MNYHNILHNDMMNGEGLRTVLFVSGCDHYCKGCQNPQTWNCDSGIPFDDSAMDEILDSLEDDAIEGLTLTGGDPLFKSNRDTIDGIVSRVRAEYGDSVTIWLYTGYTYEQILADEEMSDIVHYCDVLVDGRFELDKFSPSKPWVGSSNQNIIRIKER